MSDKISGFLPVYDQDSRVLILGSFPSVKSREVDFYYGNRQNRFWPMLSRYFKERIKEDREAKRDFVLRKKIALWDIVVECSIRGSSDASIRDYCIADLSEVLCKTHIQCILLNGATAYRLFCERYADVGVPYLRLPSTSPANPRYREADWFSALDLVYRSSGRESVSALRGDSSEI